MVLAYTECLGIQAKSHSRCIRFVSEQYTECMLCCSAVLALHVWLAEPPTTVVCWTLRCKILYKGDHPKFDFTQGVWF